MPAAEQVAATGARTLAIRRTYPYGCAAYEMTARASHYLDDAQTNPNDRCVNTVSISQETPVQKKWHSDCIGKTVLTHDDAKGEA